MTRATDISQAAARWLVRLEAQTSPEIWDAFLQWQAADPRHHAEFIRLRTAWTQVDLLKNLRPLDGTIDSDLLASMSLNPTRVTDRGLQPLEGKRRQGAQGAEDAALPRVAQPARRRWLTAVAAGAAMIVAVGILTWMSVYHPGWKSYETSVGGREEVTLEDGSTLELNTDTKLSARFMESRRDIRLERGEALFHVAHDTTRPFYVKAGGTVVRAVGTAFSVRIRDVEHIDVLVSEGRVAVGVPGSSVSVVSPVLSSSAPRISAGEIASVARNTLSVKSLASRDVSRRLAWTGGRLSFQGETLGEAVQEFNRYNQRRLTIVDPSIAPLQVGGIFSATDPDSFAAALRRSFGIQTLSTPNANDILLMGTSKPRL